MKLEMRAILVYSGTDLQAEFGGKNNILLHMPRYANPQVFVDGLREFATRIETMNATISQTEPKPISTETK